MNKNNELLKNTVIIFIGKFCIQFVSFLLVPIYTHYLIASDYGYVDLIQTYISLIAPIIILRFDSAIFRFLIEYRDKEEIKGEIISSSSFLIFLQISILSFIFIIINCFINIQYRLAIILNIIFVSISSYLLQLTRGIGRNIDYSIASIISGLMTITINIVLIISFEYNASSILYASIVANVFCSLYLLKKNKILKYFRLKHFNKNRLKEMLKYSLPMIPDGLSWWVVNVSDRTIIGIIIDTAANGIYAISCKFSNILSSLFQIFNMSWQESASLHIDDDDKDKFFTDILNKVYLIYFSICISILVVIPIVFDLLIGKEYKNAYNYIPILLLSILFNAIANIVGGVYIAKKETKRVARTTIMAAFINIIINLAFVKKIGLYAAAFSTLVSYIVVALYRYIDVKKYIIMKLNKRMFFFTLLIYVISACLYYNNNTTLNIINLIMILNIVVVINREYIKMFWERLVKLLFTKKQN